MISPSYFSNLISLHIQFAPLKIPSSSSSDTADPLQKKKNNSVLSKVEQWLPICTRRYKPVSLSSFTRDNINLEIRQGNKAGRFPPSLEEKHRGLRPCASACIAQFVSHPDLACFDLPLLFSCPVMSDSLQPHELQHARPPCLSPSPGVCPSSCSLH